MAGKRKAPVAQDNRSRPGNAGGRLFAPQGLFFLLFLGVLQPPVCVHVHHDPAHQIQEKEPDIAICGLLHLMLQQFFDGLEASFLQLYPKNWSVDFTVKFGKEISLRHRFFQMVSCLTIIHVIYDAFKQPQNLCQGE